MKKSLIIPLAMLLAVTPAFARWELDDDSDDQSFLFIASQIDTTDTVEIQVACDELMAGDILFSIFTGVDPGKSKDSSPPVLVTVAFGSVIHADLDGTVVDIEGERILDISEADEPAVRQIAEAIRKGKEMTVSYLDVSWTVPPDAAAEALPGIFDRCP